jgi:hypothetical protein
MKQIKMVILFGALLALPVTNFAQAFDDGVNLISLGFGLPPGQRITENYVVSSNFSDYKLKNYGTGILKYEHGLHKYFGIGLNFEYSAASVTYNYGNQNTTNYPYQVQLFRSVIGSYLRMNGHFPVGDKLDFYGGVGLGYIYSTDNGTDTNPSNSASYNHKKTVLDFDYQFTLGARFMVKNSFGLFAEIGYATTLAQIGIQFKF